MNKSYFSNCSGQPSAPQLTPISFGLVIRNCSLPCCFCDLASKIEVSSSGREPEQGLWRCWECLRSQLSVIFVNFKAEVSELVVVKYLIFRYQLDLTR